MGGKHHGLLNNSVVQPGGLPVFVGPQFTRSCLSFRKGKVDKTPGFVVSDTVVKARRYLESIRKGKKVQKSLEFVHARAVDSKLLQTERFCDLSNLVLLVGKGVSY